MIRSHLNFITIAGILILTVMGLVAIFGPVIAPQDPYEQNLSNRFQPPSLSHWWGTDRYGRDTLSRVILGTRYSIITGFVSVAMSAVIGVMLGIISGYKGGILDTVIMIFTDILMSFPALVLGIIVIVSLGSGAFQVIVAITIAFIPRFIRVARGTTLSLKEQEFVLAAKALGASNFRIMIIHILPNNISPAVIMATLWIGSAIIIESGLSFLGLGIQPPKASWGLLIKYGVENLMW
ncbi:hypothetical protein LCGC14_2646740, partial [marine sediment metagenome]